jgi:hypothetical protein
MATYTRTISRINTVDDGQMPAWRRAMAQKDRLYFVSAAAPGWTGGTLEKPLPTHFGPGEEDTEYGAGWDVLSGYSSGTWLEDVGGPWGTMVYGTGGHTRFQNQLLGLNLSTDAPSFSWWQQPQFQTAAVSGAEVYYNPAEFDALPAQRKIPTNESLANWDKGFPAGFDGWIYPRKLTTGQMGHNCPHGFRYATTCFVPASVTGGDSLYFATLGPQGPFAQSFMPTGGALADWVQPDALFNGGHSRRMPYYFKNTRTGAWSEHKWQPDLNVYGFTGQQCGVFRDLRRIYISADEAGGTAGWWYIDLSNGLAGMQRSEWVRPSSNAAPNRYACGAWTDGHPSGRHMVYFPDLLNTAGLVLQDFDTNQQHRLNIGKGLEIPTSSERIGMSYDAINHRILVLMVDAQSQSMYYYAIGIPADPLNAGAYTVSRTTLEVDDPAMAAQLPNATTFTRKTHLLPRLGVILVPFGRHRMLSFVPGK